MNDHLYYTALAAIAKYHTADYFLIVLEARSPRSECQHDQVGPLPVYKGLSSCCVLMW